MNNSLSKYFWIIHIISWLMAGVFNAIIQLYGNFPVHVVVFNGLSISFGGLLATCSFRVLVKKIDWLSWKKLKLFGFIFLSDVVISVIWLIVVYALFSLFFDKKISIIQFSTNLVPIGLLFMAWLLFYFSYQLLKNYHLSEIKRWKLKAQLRDTQLDILKLQINPHFLFNTLNNIRALILEDKEQARQMLTNFSELFRYSLYYTDKKEVLLKDELSVVLQYLELIKIQCEERLSYDISVENEIDNLKIPPMLIQILVENAVKHGGPPPNEKVLRIYVNVKKEENQLLIQIKNTGILKSLKKNQGLGLKNIKERLYSLYKGEAIFTIGQNNSFVEVSVKLPAYD